MHDLFKLFPRKVESPPIHVLVLRHPSERRFGPDRFTTRSFNYPFQHAHILTKAWPREFSVLVLEEPVNRKDTRRIGKLASEVQPMRKVIAHVITGERQHCEWIAADLADIAECCGGHLRTHCRGHVNAECPVERLLNQRDD